MSKQKQTVQQAKDLLTLCLAKAIDEALTAKMGPFWFSRFLEDDQEQEVAFRIARNGQNSIRDLDLQALLKILRYRDNYAQAVLVYYEFLNFNDPYEAHTRQRQIRSLLDRLITDFRNQIEAHNRVADIERNMRRRDEARLYGYQEALNDMVKLSGIFANVGSNEVRGYHRQIQRLAQTPGRTHRPRRPLVIVVSAVVLVAALVCLLSFINITPKYTPAASTTGNVYYRPGEPAKLGNQLSIQPIHVYYDNGTIVAQCYIHNGMNRVAKNIYVNDLTLYNQEGAICTASFGELSGLKLRRDHSDLWTFVFTADCISNYGADLTQISPRYSITCN